MAIIPIAFFPRPIRLGSSQQRPPAHKGRNGCLTPALTPPPVPCLLALLSVRLAVVIKRAHQREPGGRREGDGGTISVHIPKEDERVRWAAASRQGPWETPSLETQRVQHLVCPSYRPAPQFLDQQEKRPASMGETQRWIAHGATAGEKERKTPFPPLHPACTALDVSQMWRRRVVAPFLVCLAHPGDVLGRPGEGVAVVPAALRVVGSVFGSKHTHTHTHTRTHTRSCSASMFRGLVARR